MGRPGIEDWQSTLADPMQLIPWGLAAGIVGIAWRRRTGASTHLFVPVIVLGLLTLKVARVDVSFVAAAVIMLGPLLAGLGPDRFPLSGAPRRGELLVVGLLMAIGLSTSVSFAWRTAACLPIEGRRPVMPEREAVRFMQRNHLAGKMISWFDYGEYAIWHLAPAVKVSFDGRAETVYSEQVREAHMRFYVADAPDYPRELGADFVWLPNRVPAAESTPQHGLGPDLPGVALGDLRAPVS